MKILIVSYLFFQDTMIGSMRPRMMAKYLREYGHDVHVLTYVDRKTQLDHVFLENEIKGIGQYAFIERICRKARSASNSILLNKQDHLQKNVDARKNYFSLTKGSIRKTFGQLINFLEGYSWLAKCRNELKRRPFKERYDIIFSTYGPLASLFVGKYLFKKKFARHLVCDFRDLPGSEDLPFWQLKIYNHIMSRSVMEADVVTVISDGEKAMLNQRISAQARSKNNVQVIYNGFESRDDVVKGNNEGSDVLRISYTGIFYKEKRDMSMLFDVISECLAEGRMDASHIEIHYAGAMFNTLLKQANKFHINGCLIDHSLVSRKESLAIQSNSDFLVVLSWNTFREQGILTGKFYEYMAANKPIIALVSGNKPGSELSRMIDEMSLGIACEYVSYEDSKKRLKEYMLQKYEEKKVSKKLIFEPDIVKISRFDYRQIAKKLESVLYEIIKSE